MKRLPFSAAILAFLLVSNLSHAFPWPSELFLSSSAEATMRAKPSKIFALKFEGPERILAVQEASIGIWRQRSTQFNSLQSIDSNILSANFGSTTSNILSREHVISITYDRGIAGNLTVRENPRERTRLTSAAKSPRKIVWNETGGLFFLRDNIAKPVEIKFEDAKIAGVALSPNGRMMAVALQSGPIRVGNLFPDGTFEVKCSRRLGRQSIRELVFSPDGQLLAVGDTGRLILIDPHTSQRVRIFERNFGDGDISTIAFSNRSEYVAIGSMAPNPVVRVFQVSNGQALGDFESKGETITALAFDPSGLRLVSGDALGKMVLWRPSASTGFENDLSLPQAWKALSSIDPKVARNAMNWMISRPVDKRTETINYLKDRLAENNDNDEEFREAIKQLDHRNFRVRQLAKQKLLNGGLPAIEVMRDQNQASLGNEGQELLQSILNYYEEQSLFRSDWYPYSRHIHLVRALGLLEELDPVGSKSSIEKIQKQFPKTQVARDAEAILSMP